MNTCYQTSDNSVFAFRFAHPNAFDTSQTRRTLYEIARFRKISTNGRRPIQIASIFGPNGLAQQRIKVKSKISAKLPVGLVARRYTALQKHAVYLYTLIYLKVRR